MGGGKLMFVKCFQLPRWSKQELIWVLKPTGLMGLLEISVDLSSVTWLLLLLGCLRNMLRASQMGSGGCSANGWNQIAWSFKNYINHLLAYTDPHLSHQLTPQHSLCCSSDLGSNRVRMGFLCFFRERITDACCWGHIHGASPAHFSV